MGRFLADRILLLHSIGTILSSVCPSVCLSVMLCIVILRVGTGLKVVPACS